MLDVPRVVPGYRIRWYVWAGPNADGKRERIPHKATMRGHWPGYDAECECRMKHTTKTNRHHIACYRMSLDPRETENAMPDTMPRQDQPRLATTTRFEWHRTAAGYVAGPWTIKQELVWVLRFRGERVDAYRTLAEAKVGAGAYADHWTAEAIPAHVAERIAERDRIIARLEQAVVNA